jgi:hypothetical protein
LFCGLHHNIEGSRPIGDETDGVQAASLDGTPTGREEVELFARFQERVSWRAGLRTAKNGPMESTKSEI